jgi:hypothetical protein
MSVETSMEHLDLLTAFRHSLAEAIAWCATRATISDPERCLRTTALEPGPLDYHLSVPQRQECVARLVQARSRLLQEAGVYPLTPATELAGGHLLVFYPDETLSDGAAAVGSRRFFDDDNVPPWDSWVLYVADPLHPTRQTYLVSWVAPALIPLAHDGVIVNPESCIEWLADRDTPFTHALQELHLLV